MLSVTFLQSDLKKKERNNNNKNQLVTLCGQSNHTLCAFSFAFYSFHLFVNDASYCFTVPDKPVSRGAALAHLNRLPLKSF